MYVTPVITEKLQLKKKHLGIDDTPCLPLHSGDQSRHKIDSHLFHFQDM